MKRLLQRWRSRAGRPDDLTCQELVELVTDYLEDSLDSRDRARFEAHIAGCDGCSAYIVQMRETLSVVGAIQPESLSAQVEADLLAAFRTWKAGEGEQGGT